MPCLLLKYRQVWRGPGQDLPVKVRRNVQAAIKKARKVPAVFQCGEARSVVRIGKLAGGNLFVQEDAAARSGEGIGIEVRPGGPPDSRKSRLADIVVARNGYPYQLGLPVLPEVLGARRPLRDPHHLKVGFGQDELAQIPRRDDVGD